MGLGLGVQEVKQVGLDLAGKDLGVKDPEELYEGTVEEGVEPGGDLCGKDHEELHDGVVEEGTELDEGVVQDDEDAGR